VGFDVLPIKKNLKIIFGGPHAAFDLYTGLPFVPVAVQPAEGRLYMT